MSMFTPVHFAVARALCRTSPLPAELARSTDWLAVADEFILAVSGDVSLVPKEDYDRLKTSLRDIELELRAVDKARVEGLSPWKKRKTAART